MTRYTSFRILFLVIFLVSSQTNSAATHTNTNTVSVASVGDSKEMNVNSINPAIPFENTPALPASAESQHPVEKEHSMTMNELAHIHHFHKERVKKIKRHHSKYWFLSKVLLIICHIVLLIIAYLHVSH